MNEQKGIFIQEKEIGLILGWYHLLTKLVNYKTVEDEDDLLNKLCRPNNLIRKEILQEAIQRLNSTHNVGQMFLDNLSNKDLRETALYTNFQTVNKKNKSMIDMLKEVFELDIK